MKREIASPRSSTSRARDVARALAAEFGAQPCDAATPSDRAYRIAQRLACGAVVRTADGAWYYGFAEYRHGGSAFSLCQSMSHRSWPDQLWDVIPFAGWVKVTKEMRKAWGIHGRRGVEEHALNNVKGALREWQAYANGEYVGYVARLIEFSGYDDPTPCEDADGEHVASENIWGYYDASDALADATTTAAYWAKQYSAQP